MNGFKHLGIIMAAAAMLALAAPGAARADHYKVGFSTARADDDGALRLARVEATITPDKGRIRLTRYGVDTGIYHGWAGFLVTLEAEDRNGKPIALAYEAPGVWRVPPSSSGEITVRYAVNLQHDRFPNEPGDNELAYARSYGVMWTARALFVEGAPATDTTVEFDLPQGWKVSTPWPRRAGNGWVFAPKDTDDLLDAAFLAGTHREITIDLGKAQALIALGPPVQRMGPSFESLIRKYFGAYTELFRDPPEDNFLLIAADASFLGGGVMGRTISLSLNEQAAGPQARAIIAYIVAHEGFHLWNARWFVRTRSKHAGEVEWLKEGAAEYYGFLTSWRLGVIDEPAFLKFVSERAGAYLTALGSGESLVSAASTKHTSQHSYDLLYNGGMMVLLALDLEIRAATNGGKSLDDVIRAVHAEYADVKTALTLAALSRVIERETGFDFSTMVRRHIRGREPLDLAGALIHAGMIVRIEKKGGATTATVSRSTSPSPPQLALYRNWASKIGKQRDSTRRAAPGR